jgi:hypothetical protein
VTIDVAHPNKAVWINPNPIGGIIWVSVGILFSLFGPLVALAFHRYRRGGGRYSVGIPLLCLAAFISVGFGAIARGVYLFFAHSKMTIYLDWIDPLFTSSGALLGAMALLLFWRQYQSWRP